MYFNVAIGKSHLDQVACVGEGLRMHQEAGCSVSVLLRYRHLHVITADISADVLAS